MDRLRTAHPWFRADRTHPIRETRNESEIFADVLFADQSDRHNPASRDRDRGAEEAFEHENAFGVVAESAVPEIRCDGFGFVEPLMQREIIFGLAAPLAHRR